MMSCFPKNWEWILATCRQQCDWYNPRTCQQCQNLCSNRLLCNGGYQWSQSKPLTWFQRLETKLPTQLVVSLEREMPKCCKIRKLPWTWSLHQEPHDLHSKWHHSRMAFGVRLNWSYQQWVERLSLLYASIMPLTLSLSLIYQNLYGGVHILGGSCCKAYLIAVSGHKI